MPEKAKNQPADHQREYCDDPVFCPDLSKIDGLAERISREQDEEGKPLPFNDIRESMCGGIDDSMDVEQYDGSLGPSTAFVAKHEPTVGLLRWNRNLASLYDNPGTVAGAAFCTGTMITNDLLLTAGHCFDQTGGGWQRPRVNGTTNIIPPSEIATNMSVEFNFQVDAVGNLRQVTSVPVVEMIEYRLGGRDFAIVRLDGTPGRQFGIGRLAPADPQVGEQITIISHPAGRPKQIEAGHVTQFDGFRIRYNDIDTLGGSSGAGIIRERDGCLVGIHTNGGCDQAMSGSNFGLRIDELRRVSPTVQSLQAHTTPAALDLIRVAQPPRTWIKILVDQLKTPITSPLADRFTDPLGDRITHPVGDRFTHPIGDAGTDPWADSRGTPNQSFDNRKIGALDKQFSDNPRFGRAVGGTFGSSVGQGSLPLVLATPHHAPGVESTATTDDDEIVVALEEAIVELATQLDELVAEYAAMVERQ